jgi:hypothetical protein
MPMANVAKNLEGIDVAWLARQNISGRCAVRRGAGNALRFKSVGEHAGIGSAIALRTIVFHAALVASGRAHGHQRRNRA